ncbi:RNA polymerase sigma-70 factor, ECF subfamily [Chitinophaga sp. CF118]|uniref:RNA polymerase sigma factor n=1 Tax=Chitinophaga sp. CF118 TaxID=1884367 RepID=UPI0008F05F2D|nr:RNA polymerase sigma-70 factor [Chitinophaga sp. CF118]SFE06139.1 RNA polymerase sigma-70 factor, ECF subfamily [Chitinophaga sp. CF118]
MDSAATQDILLAKVAAGDEGAFRELFDRHRNKLYAYMLRLSNERVVAEDIVQEVFLKIWIGREQLAGIRNFDAYLFTIARNHAFNLSKQIIYRKALLCEITSGQPQSDISTENDVDYKNLQSLLARELSKLPPQQRKIFTLSRFEGLSNEDIAREQSIAVGTVKKHLSLATQTLKAALKDNMQTMVILGIMVRNIWQ